MSRPMAVPKRPRTGGAARPPRMKPQVKCDFPTAADAAKIDRASVVLGVDVAADGTVTRTKLISDPGYGFGAAAQRCAKSFKFDPALDDRGIATASSVPVRVMFRR